MYVLVLLGPTGQRKKELPLGADRVSIGSDAGNTIVIPKVGVEPRHCALERVDGGYKIVDLHTDHGTQVNGSYIVQRRLEPGDRVEFGGLTFVFERKQVARAPVATPIVRAAPAPRREAPAATTADDDDEFVDAPEHEVIDDPEALAAAEPPLHRRPTFGMSLAWATAGLVLIGGIWVVGQRFLSSKPQGPSLETLRREQFAALIGGGLFDDADRMLERAVGEASLSGSARDQLRQTLEQAKARVKFAREALTELEADPKASKERRIARLEELLDRYRDVPEVAAEIAVALRLAQDMAPVVDPKDALPTIGAVAARADAAMKGSDYASAVAAWQSLQQSAQHADIAAVAAGRRAIDEAARVGAEALSRRADAALAKNDVLGALVLLDESELNAFRGTPYHLALEARASEVEALAGKSAQSSGLVPTPVVEPSPTDVAAAKPDPAETTKPAKQGSSEFDKPKPVVVDPAVSALSEVLKSADEAFAAGDFAGSAALCQAQMSASLNLSATGVLTRRIERANRARWFLEALVHAIENQPTLANGVMVKDRAGTVEGEAKAVLDGMLLVKTGTGDVRVSPEQLAPASALVLARRAKWKAEDELNLAFFALSSGDEKLFAQAIEKAAADPSLKVPVDSAIAFSRGLPEVPEWGFFRHDDRWLSFKEREEAKNGTLVEAAFAKLDKRDEERAAGLEELKSLLPVARAAVLDRLRQRRAVMVEQLTSATDLAELDGLLEKRRELDRRRAHALELINDDVKYFYPYNPPECPADKAKLYAAVQQDVDDRVAQVREIWGDEFEETSSGFSLSSKFKRTYERLLEEEAILVAADGEGFSREVVMERIYLLPAKSSRVTLRNVALTPAERERLDRDADVLKFNATAQTSAQKQEVEQIWITNMYRLMFGRRALAIHDKLVRSSRGHSEWMARTGIFDHFETGDPKRRTPGDRIKLEGYEAGGSGENLAMIGGARAAHDAWCHSSGHHRNLLFDSHVEMGVGNVGNYWTQNFAGGGDYGGNLTDE
jgi:uncharacterized protein YkwD